MGFNKSLKTHKLVYDESMVNAAMRACPVYSQNIIKVNRANGKTATNDKLVFSFGDQTCSSLQSYDLVRTNKDLIPCWFFSVPKHVVDGHGGIWNSNLYGMLAALEGMTYITPGASTDSACTQCASQILSSNVRALGDVFVIL